MMVLNWETDHQSLRGGEMVSLWFDSTPTDSILLCAIRKNKRKRALRVRNGRKTATGRYIY